MRQGMPRRLQAQAQGEPADAGADDDDIHGIAPLRGRKLAEGRGGDQCGF